MRIKFLIVTICALLILSGCRSPGDLSSSPASSTNILRTITLPEPRFESDISLEEALHQRRSIREYSGEALSLEEIAQLLWAAQGITSSEGFRTAPSAGGLYPLEVYVAAGDVENLTAGVYRYLPGEHALGQLKDIDVREDLTRAALNQAWIEDGAIDIVITAVYERTTQKYGDRGIRYAQIEAGHAAQNICLQAVVLNLGVVTVGAFEDNRIKSILNADAAETPLYIIPVGKRN